MIRKQKSAEPIPDAQRLVPEPLPYQGSENPSLEALLEAMKTQQASDLVITAGTLPQLRINGLLHGFGAHPVTPEESDHYARELLSDAQFDALHECRTVDCSRELPDKSRYRINGFFQKDATALVLRLISMNIPSFDDLGLPPIIREFALCPHGLFLVTGPAGSGKSTTLAAMLDYINARRAYHIVCIEDPVEYVHEHGCSTIEQREIGSDARSFAEALRSVFRQSPDVIMLGEMRDLETMQLALSLAETGHLILATLHTQDTSHAINRIVDAFPPSQQQQVYIQLALVLQGIISQQLILSEDRTRRVLAYEVLKVNTAIRNLIRESEVQQIYSVLQTGKGEGMLTMNESLANLYGLQLINRDTALMRSPNPKELRRLLEYKSSLAERGAK